MSNGDAVTAEAILGEDGAFQEDWLDQLPEGTFEKDDTGKPIRANVADHKDLASLIKSSVSAQQLLGTAVQPLKEGATEDETKEFLAKIGFKVPDSPDGYEIQKPTDLPEGMEYREEVEKEFRAFAHTNKIPQRYVAAVINYFNAMQVGMFKAGQEAKDTTAKEATAKLTASWGVDYDKNVEMGRRAYDLPGNDETNKAFKDLMAEEGLNNHPVVASFFYELYKLVGEGEFIEGTPAGGEKGKEGELVYDKTDKAMGGTK